MTSNWERVRTTSLRWNGRSGTSQAGDVIQAVISQRFGRRTGAHPFEVYRSLRTINPSPYMYYLQFGETYIVGASPELLVKVEQERGGGAPDRGHPPTWRRPPPRMSDWRRSCGTTRRSWRST